MMLHHDKIGILHICENKGTDQLRGNRSADQHLCFHYIANTFPLDGMWSTERLLAGISFKMASLISVLMF